MSKRPIRADDLKRFKHVSEPRVSPDGSRVLFSMRELGEKNKTRTHLFTVDLFDHSVKQWTFGEGSNSSGRWSPDGKTIAFLAKRTGGLTQIHLLPADGGEARALTSLAEGSISDIRWSPDGSRIAFLFRPTHEDFTQAAEETRKGDGGSTPPIIAHSLHYRMDGDGYFGDQRYALWVVEIATGEARQVYSEAKIDFYSYDWQSDGQGFVVSHPVYDQNPVQEVSNDRIYRVGLDGSSVEIAGQVIGEKSALRVSPNGQQIAYLGYASEVDERGDFNRRLFVIPVDGGETRCLTPDDDVCLSTGVNSDTKSDDGTQLQWSPDSQAIYVQIAQHGAMDLGYVMVNAPGLQHLTEGEHLVYLGNVSQDGEKIACTWGDATALQEIAVYPLGAHPKVPAVLTHFNDDLLAELELVKPQTIWLDTPDGTKVQAWSMAPVGGVEGPSPAILEVHGGPHMMYGYSFMHEFQLFCGEGYWVVFSNPRGSKGYGEAHAAAIRNSWGDKDWVDIQVVRDWMKAHPGMDYARLGIMGGSYGGYMTNWAIGHTRDFKAAITDRCVSNLVSKAGNSDYMWRPEGYWDGYGYGGFDKIKRLWECSPIAYFDQAVTPTLVIHSEGDLRCNIEQGEQVFAALQQRGVPSKFVRYPRSTSHGMSRGGPTDLRIHRLNEFLGWWETHLK